MTTKAVTTAKVTLAAFGGEKSIRSLLNAVKYSAVAKYLVKPIEVTLNDDDRNGWKAFTVSISVGENAAILLKEEILSGKLIRWKEDFSIANGS